MISDRQILQHIERQPKSSAGFKQLVRELGLRGNERRELDARLRAMLRNGELVEIGRDRYALPVADKGENKNLVSGRLHMHRDGYGFVIPQNPALKEKLDGDIFIPASAIGLAMHGDVVMVELGKVGGDRRAEGRIVKVAGRAHSTVVGTFHYGGRTTYATPMEERIAKDIVIPHGLERPDGSGFLSDMAVLRAGVQTELRRCCCLGSAKSSAIEWPNR